MEQSDACGFIGFITILQLHARAFCPGWASGPSGGSNAVALFMFAMVALCYGLVVLARSPVPQPTVQMGFGYAQMVYLLGLVRLRWSWRWSRRRCTRRWYQLATVAVRKLEP